MILPRLFILRIILASLLLWTAPSYAADELEVTVLEQDLFVTRFPAQGEQLLLWIAPGFDSKSRVVKMAEQVADNGVEIWRVDLAESLFLPKSTSTLRSLSGKYVAGLIEQAHLLTGKQITLVGRSYSAIPILRGARIWQQQQAKKKSVAPYFSGAILFSPELYATVPALGLEPVYVPEVSASNIPMMIYQASNRSNRWQLNHVLSSLRKGGASVYLKMLQGITGVFYEGDKSEAVAETLMRLPGEISRVVNLLQKTPMPRTAPRLVENKKIESHGLDINLKPYTANPIPLPLDLYDVSGEHVVRDNYKGKVTVVNFWATWCPPCVEEIPSLNRLREAMHGKAFELISIDYAEDKRLVEDFLKRVNVDFPVLLDSDGRVSARWGALVFPSTFVIGPDGTIKYGVNGGIIWDSPDVINTLNSLLDE